MTSSQQHYRSLLDDLRKTYLQAYTVTVAQGRTGTLETQAGSLWGDLSNRMNDVLEWSDLLVAQKLRYRAHHAVLEVPGRHWSMSEIIHRNPWLQRHKLTMTPMISERVRAMMSSEKEFMLKQRVTRAAITRGEVVSVPLHRLEMQYRHAISEIANVSESIQLSVPEVGDAFPIGEYLTRDDHRVRPTHRAMYGFVAARTHRVWSIIRPPCGFNCRCYVIWRTRGDARRRRWPENPDNTWLRWPNSASERNFDQKIFPDEGWRGPKVVST
jgi:SPP1 gp7 family putative phage head morphogenesis protein